MLRNRMFFTLIELLVVIAIISILMTILLSVLNTGQEKMLTTRCADNLRQLGTGAAEFSADHRGEIIAANKYLPGKTRSEVTTGEVAWKYQIGNYVYPNSGVDYIAKASGGSQDVARCGVYGCIHEDLYTKAFECPNNVNYVSSDGTVTYDDLVGEDEKDAWRMGGIGINYLIKSENEQDVGTDVLGIYPKAMDIDKPSEFLLLGDTMIKDVDPYYTWRLWYPTTSQMNDKLYMTHGTGINALWADYHVQWMDNHDLLYGPHATSLQHNNYYFHYKK